MIWQIEVYTSSDKYVGNISVSESTTVRDMKNFIKKISNIETVRQSIRTELKGKNQNDDLTAENLKLQLTKKIFVKDLGPQIGWNTVFLLEYAGPMILYALVALRPWILYGTIDGNERLSTTAMVALFCWTAHYLKRILETLFVHRFSHGTMPLSNLFKNCGYYWGFCVYVAYHVNHPKFTPPPTIISIIGFIIFLVCEIGNFSIHILLRNLRPAGTNERKIPVPNGFILTQLFNFVSCPNYTYEFGAWMGFTLMTSCLPAALFATAGLYQMTLWAIGKHKNYKKEFPKYPKERKAIIPFVI